MPYVIFHGLSITDYTRLAPLLDSHDPTTLAHLRSTCLLYIVELAYTTRTQPFTKKLSNTTSSSPFSFVMVGVSPRPRSPNPYPPTFNGPHLLQSPLSRPLTRLPGYLLSLPIPHPFTLPALSASSSSHTLAHYLSPWFRSSRPCAFLQMPPMPVQSAPPIVSSALDDVLNVTLLLFPDHHFIIPSLIFTTLHNLNFLLRCGGPHLRS